MDAGIAAVDAVALIAIVVIAVVGATATTARRHRQQRYYDNPSHRVHGRRERSRMHNEHMKPRAFERNCDALVPNKTTNIHDRKVGLK